VDQLLGAVTVFPDDGGAMIARFDQQWQQTLGAALDRAGLPRLTLHQLRHAYASFFVMSGGSIFDLQRNLGHSSVMLTSEVYAHLSPDHRLSDAQRISYPEPQPAAVIPLRRSSADTDPSDAREADGAVLAEAHTS
jgi:integrase